MPTGAETDFALATAKATSPRVLTQALGLAAIPRVGISQSSPPASIRSTCRPRLLALRIRAAMSG